MFKKIKRKSQIVARKNNSVSKAKKLFERQF